MAIVQSSASRSSDFERLTRLGAGSFGEVFKVRRLADEREYVLKQVNIDGMNTREQCDAIQEVRIMASLSHHNVVRYFDSFLDEGKLNIIMEYCDRGDLQQYLKRRRDSVPEDEIWKLFLQIAAGLHYLHAQRVLHRDMKSANVFMCSDDSIKIGDLGVARVLGTNTNFARTSVGTPYYLSPELCEDKPYNEKSDVWALGCILYECCTLKHPFDANNQGALILKIIQGKYEPVSAKYSRDMRRLVDHLLSRDTRKRPNVTQLLAMDVCYRKAKEFGLPLPPDVEAAAAARQKKVAAVAAAVSEAAEVVGKVTGSVGGAVASGGVITRPVLGSPSLPPKPVMMKSPSGLMRVSGGAKAAAAQAVAASGGIRGDRIRKGAAIDVAKGVQPRRMPLSNEAKAAAAAAAAANSRPSSRHGVGVVSADRSPLAVPRATTPDGARNGRGPASNANGGAKVVSPAPARKLSDGHRKVLAAAAADVAALPDVVGSGAVRSGSRDRVRPTISQLAEATQPNPVAHRAAGPSPLRPQASSPDILRHHGYAAASADELDELMDRHLAANVKPVVSHPSSPTTVPSSAPVRSAVSSVSSPAPLPISGFIPSAASVAPKPKSKRVITVVKTAYVPDEILPEELEGMPDDFFDPVVAHTIVDADSASLSHETRTLSPTRVAPVVSDVKVSTIEMSAPVVSMEESEAFHHPSEHGVVFVGVSETHKRGGAGVIQKQFSSIHEELEGGIGDGLVTDSKFEEEPPTVVEEDGEDEEEDDGDDEGGEGRGLGRNSAAYNSDQLSDYGDDDDDDDGGDDEGDVGGAGASALSDLMDEQARLSAVLARNLESCKALLPADVFARIEEELESNSSTIDAGSFTTDPTGYLMIYKVAHFVAQLRENEEKIRALS